jgi:hypothetical protein
VAFYLLEANSGKGRARASTAIETGAVRICGKEEATMFNMPLATFSPVSQVTINFTA